MLAPITVVPTVVCYDDALRALVLNSIRTKRLQFPGWLANPWVQMFMYQWNFKNRYGHIQFDRYEIPVGPIGDVIALDWLHDQAHLPANAPVCMISSTLVGGSRDVAEYADQMAKRGFRVVVQHRRGHDGLRLCSHKWNLMGSKEDLHEAIEHVRILYPHAKLTLLGISAGTGLIVRYLSWKGEEAPIAGVILVSPGWDLMDTWRNMHPLISLVFAGGIKRRVLWRHRDVLSTAPLFWYAMLWCWTMTGLYPALRGVGGFGVDELDEFIAASDPVAQVESITVPTVVFNNEDDPACPYSSVNHGIFRTRLNGVLISLRRGGSHLGGYTSRFGPSWTSQTAADILLALVQRQAA